MTATDVDLRGLHRLAPVSLAELVERAALLSRVDRKYLVPTADLGPLLAALDGSARVLEIDDRRAFGYRSIYFDTPTLDSFHSTARRRRRRFKVRTRSYLDNDLHVLEVKTRGPRGLTVKQQLDYTGDGHELSADDRAGVVDRLAPLHIRLDGRSLRPVLHTHYERATLLLERSGGRVTLDTGLVWSRVGGPPGSARTALVVVETKSAGAAGPVDRLLWSLGHRPVSISKFGTGMAALAPELPANRWRPVLRHHLTLTDPTPGSERP